MIEDDRPGDAAEFIAALLGSPGLGRQVAHHRLLPGRDASYAEPRRPWPPAIRELLRHLGAPRLYSHQAKACDILRSGRNVAVATPTASGKSLTYTLPVLEELMRDPASRALYLFPLKALAQDQLRVLNDFLSLLPESARPRAAIFDGDTPAGARRKLRTDPPQIIMTNPEMLHLSLLPYHANWATFLAGLTHIVVDEMHTYRGVMGSHMAQVFRRLRRVCARYGARPNFIFCSATIGNPGELAQSLSGLEVETVKESGAPAAPRHFVFINPDESPASAAVTLLRAALPRGLRSIVYTGSRKMTELVAMWLSERAKTFEGRISSYRSGFLPEQRREIEAKLSSGELLAVVSTSALELGIDIGGLDLCVLVGYPGSVMSTWQRGGRVGRAGRESAVILLAGEDALDQYFMRNPNDFFEREPESAVLNPHNPAILAKHLECAAAELPFEKSDPWLNEPETKLVVDDLLAKAKLLFDREGERILSPRKNPQREVDLRGSGSQYSIEAGEQVIGLTDELRAFKENHPGAVYLHQGLTYVVKELSLPERVARVVPAKVDYYTRPRGRKDTEILEVLATGQAFGLNIGFGRLKVTEWVTGYEKRRIKGGTLVNIVPLDLPEITYETEGLWLEIPRSAQRRMEDEMLHFMGAIHAMEHAAIGVMPLLVLTDRNDLGGISTPIHAQLGRAAVFIYDGAAGGVGLTAEAFSRAKELLERTLHAVADCPCESGCPSCVHSPKCGSGNRPIDKFAALKLLEMCISASPEDPPCRELPGPDRNASACQATDRPRPAKYGVLDVETRRSAEEVGGWRNAHLMGVSVAVLYLSETDEYRTYTQDELYELVKDLQKLDLLVGFNIKRFDYKVLSGCVNFPFENLPTLDMLDEVKKRLNYRLSLDSLASATLGSEKTGDGLAALRWWKEGNIEKIAAYCRDDVRLTRDLYLYGAQNGYLIFRNKAKNLVRLPIDW